MQLLVAKAQIKIVPNAYSRPNLRCSQRDSKARPEIRPAASLDSYCDPIGVVVCFCASKKLHASNIFKILVIKEQFVVSVDPDQTVQMHTVKLI